MMLRSFLDCLSATTELFSFNVHLKKKKVGSRYIRGYRYRFHFVNFFMFFTYRVYCTVRIALYSALFQVNKFHLSEITTVRYTVSVCAAHI